MYDDMGFWTDVGRHVPMGIIHRGCFSIRSMMPSGSLTALLRNPDPSYYELPNTARPQGEVDFDVVQTAVTVVQ